MKNNNKIKILYIINDIRLGGAQKVLADLIVSLDKNKFEPVVCSLKFDNDQWDNFNNLSKYSDFRVVQMPQTNNTLSLFFKLLSFIREEKPAIVHCHLPWATILGVVASRLAAIKNIIIHDHNTPKFYAKKIRLALFFTRFLASLSLCYSSSVQKEIFGKVSVFDKSDIRINKKSYTIYNGVNLKEIDKVKNTVDFENKRNSLGVSKDDILVLTVSRLISWKGHKNLLEAMAMAQKKNNNIKLLVVGYGPEEKNILESIKKLGLEKSVIFLGPRRDALEIMAVSDIFSSVLAYPKDFNSESVGVSALEAMAIPLAVIIGQYPGRENNIKDRDNVLIVEPNNPVELAEAIIKLVNDKDFRKKISNNSRNLIKKNYSWDYLGSLYEHLYNLLII
jgi:glycosyltransferase involved in cell wall biosynthesis